MRKGLAYLFIFIVLLAGPTAVRYLRFYDLTPSERALPPAFNPADVQDVPTPPGTKFTDNPEMGSGYVLLDVAHQNNFTMDDITYLDGRLAARGIELLPFDGGDLTQALRLANAFVVITPLTDYTFEEAQAVTRFVHQGGRVLLIGDPTRFKIEFDENDPFGSTSNFLADEIPLNSLANEFDIVFNGDYLYNTVENEGNFRNIILNRDGFAEDSLVDGLQKLAFYSTHSLQVGPTGNALITADNNTWSSATDRSGGLILGATSQQGHVLALGDIHFLTQPYFTVFDNGRFITRIADFLAESIGRHLALADFPYFYHSPVNLVYTGAPDLGPDAFDEIIALQEAFRRVDRTLSLAAAPEPDADVFYLGLYNQAEDVAAILESSGITFVIDPPIVAQPDPAQGDGPGLPEPDEEMAEETAVRLIQSSLGSVQMAGTALVFLDESEDQRQVIVLAASNQGLENTINRLLNLIPLNADYALSDCLLQDNLALCPSNVANEEVEAELDSSGSPDSLAEEPPTPAAENGADNIGGGGPVDDLGALPQGTIGVGQIVTGTLAEGESHSWTFNTGPATIDLILVGEGMDGVLAIYGPDNELLAIADNTITDEEERLSGIEIPDSSEYTIVVQDFFGRNVNYALTILESGS